MALTNHSIQSTCFVLLLLGLTSFATANTNPLSQTRLSGFITTGVATSNNATPILLGAEINDHVNFLADTVLGVQIDATIDDKTRFSSQIIANDSTGGFDLNAEWIYIARNLTPLLELRAGRLRTPIYLFSDTIYVGVTYPWVRTPDEVYNLFANITRYSGMDLNYDLELGNTNNNLRVFVGEIKEDLDIAQLNLKFETKEMYGLELTSTTMNNLARIMIMQISVAEIAGFPGAPSIGKTQVISVADRFNHGRFELITEYAYRIIPDGAEGKDITDWGWYGTISYTKSDFTPYITYAIRDASRSIINYTRDSESVTVGAKHYLNPDFAANVEVQYAQAKQESRGVFTAAPKHDNALITTIAITARF